MQKGSQSECLRKFLAKRAKENSVAEGVKEMADYWKKKLDF